MSGRRRSSSFSGLPTPRDGASVPRQGSPAPPERPPSPTASFASTQRNSTAGVRRKAVPSYSDTATVSAIPFGPRAVSSKALATQDAEGLQTINFARRLSSASSSTDDLAVPPVPAFPFGPSIAAQGRSAPIANAPTYSKRANPPKSQASRPSSVHVGALRTLYDAPTRPTEVSPTSSDLASPATKTRQSLDSFASYEMLQGQRDHAEMRRGSEVFREGKYEGRSLEALNRRTDPAESVRIARGVQRASIAPQVDIAAALATWTGERRESVADEKRFDHDWRRRFSSTSSQGSPAVSPQAVTAFAATKGFAFPSRPASTVNTTPAPPYPADRDLGEPESPFSEKFLYADKEVKSAGWTKDYAFALTESPRKPSIVALPVYPSPSGSLARSLSYRLKRLGTKFSFVTLLLAQVATALYFVKRIEALQIVEEQMPSVFLAGWIFLGVELLIAVLLAVHSVVAVFSYKSTGSLPKFRLRGDLALPAVDVFIISSGQADQIVFDSAIAAASMDYPPHRFRVLVIDPVGSSSLQKMVLNYSKTQTSPHLSYHRRSLHSGRGDIHHSKSNSLNFGIAAASTMGGRGGGDLIAVFEGDVIAERNFLRAALPPFVAGNARIALVKTPSGFINLPNRLSQSTATLISATDPASVCRSGFVLRRSALADIGGFPAGSWLQDGRCEALLAGKAFDVVELDEVLSFGTARATYGEQIGAAMVDGLGPLRTAAKLKFFLGGKKIQAMPWSTRLANMARAARPLLSVVITLLTMIYPFTFSYGGILVLTPDLPNLNTLLQFTFAMVLFDRLHEFMWTWSTGLASPRREFQKWIFFAPYQGISILLLMLPAWLGGYVKGDIKLGSTPVTNVRPKLSKRIWWTLLDPHTSVVCSFLGSIGVAIWRATRDYERGTVNVNQTALTILLTIGWPSLLWLDFLFGSIVAFSCLLFPSKLLTASRDEFLIRDHHTGVARPKHSYKTANPLKVHRWSEIATGVLMVGYAGACVAVGLTTQLFA